MRVPAITFGLVVSLVLALGAIWFTGCVSQPSPRHRFTCAQTGVAQYDDADGNVRRVLLYACED